MRLVKSILLVFVQAGRLFAFHCNVITIIQANLHIIDFEAGTTLCTVDGKVSEWLDFRAI